MLDFSKNYFELFGLPAVFELDGAELARRYRELQRAVHPDRYTNATEQEKRLSMQGASRINDALETLKDPLSRARYLLELKGVDLEQGGGNIADSGFLMEQMELREELAQARHQDDPHAAVAALMAHIGCHIQALLKAMGERFEAGAPGDLEQAKEIVNKLQFLYKLRAQAEELEAELDEEL